MQTARWETYSLPVPRSATLREERLLLGLVAQRSPYPANLSHLARLFHCSRTTARRWADKLRDVGLVREDDGHLVLVADAYEDWKAAEAQELAQRGIPWCCDMLPWPVLRRKQPKARRLTPKMLLAAAVQIGEACRAIQFVRLDTERAQLAGVSVSTVRAARRRLKQAKLLGVELRRVGYHKKVAELQFCKASAKGRPINDDTAATLAAHAARGHKRSATDPAEVSRAERTEVSRGERLSELPYGKNPDQAAGGGASPVKQSSRQQVCEQLAGISYTAGQLDAAADLICNLRGDQAVSWTQKQIQQLRSDSNVQNPAATLRWRLDAGQADPANDRPARPADHDAGQQIRDENMQRQQQQAATDPAYQRRQVAGMLHDRKPVEFIASELGISAAEVRRIVSEAQIDDHAPMTPPAADRASEGRTGFMHLVQRNRDQNTAHAC